MRRGESLADLQRLGSAASQERDLSGSTSSEFKPDLSGGISGKRLAKNAQTGVVLDREILRQAIIPLTGDMTFLEAFDVSGESSGLRTRLRRLGTPRALLTANRSRSPDRSRSRQAACSTSA